ncbi:DinB superfamily protein [Mucilaginibacter pineti]|uniref:DinB superfamily protein n=1 Tax=Mucilaginibacter pineti TaxID=1391627 RepID=A0A1G7FGU4_9SPHI|nr:DinB family protein [Mucilaginibacter pineti]SDE75092.1 DinB superfamily protein [Mucilaginibacter pineti]
MIKRPNPDEYSPFAAGYIGQVPNENVIELLEQSMNRSYDLFSSLSETQAAYAYAPDKWTVKEAVGHMIDTERTFAYRAMVFSRNNIELPGFDQDIYVANADFNNRSIKDLAAEFKTLRQSNIYMIKGFNDAQLMREGIASNARFTVRAFVYMLAGHELHHYNIFKERYGIS